jgi:ribonuclease-3
LKFLANIYRNNFSAEREYYRSLKTLLGFTPRNLRLYRQAFTHNTVKAISSDTARVNNERLEYLGDAVLGAIVAEILFKKFPYKDEGFLTELRSKIVNRESLGQLGIKLGLDELLEYDRRMKDVPLRIKSMTGDAFEALIAAIYLDKGYNHARHYVEKRIIRYHLDISALETLQTNYKSRLIEWSQKNCRSIDFELVEERNFKHSRQFIMRVLIDKEEKGVGIDFSKKKAEQLAAQQAYLQVLV